MLSPSKQASVSKGDRLREVQRHIQANETYLDDTQRVVIADYFETNPHAADTYQTLPTPGPRQIWVLKRLREAGFPSPSPSGVQGAAPNAAGIPGTPSSSTQFKM